MFGRQRRNCKPDLWRKYGSDSEYHNQVESLKKKHVAISYHKTRKAAASDTVHPIKTDITINYAFVQMACYTTLFRSGLKKIHSAT